MAKAAAPFVHARVGSLDVTGRDGEAIATPEMSDFEAARRIAFLLTKAARQVEGDS